MSLADELLADLEENDNEELETLIEAKTSTSNNEAHQIFGTATATVVPMEEDIKNVSIRELAKLRDSPRLQSVILFIFLLVINLLSAWINPPLLHK
jgi:U4/U6 small nuclear ribonucleoprotein PRP31